ncbi:MAG: lycopene beta-cyclase CrtY [Rhizobiaceae bacterium]|nr:lycopene beta-cyclase CrtY [Rhizobiaceae bacterium]
MSAIRLPESVEGRYDVIFVGGGLANGLIAYRLKTVRSSLRLLVVEAGDKLGGNHTWSFHKGDLTAAQHRWLAPFVVHRWQGYEARFPERTRSVATGYMSVTSERFAGLLGDRLGVDVWTGTAVATFDATSVVLADGRRIEAGCVIDGRGPSPSPHLTLGFQKFLGQELELTEPHGLESPVIMDATVPQSDGYRFVYVLPFGPKTVLVEDTYYADGPALDPARLRAEIATYVARRGWTVARVLREEDGVLPIALGGNIKRFWAARDGLPASGLAAALFHPTTGYSLPDAVRLAERIASLEDLSAPSVFKAARGHSMAIWKARSYFRMLNRLLFLAGAPEERYRILQHFYRLPDALVARFYAGELSWADRLRILTGKPPVSLPSALRVLAAPSHSMKTVPSLKDHL